ncbi:MAG: site-2 protease family protein [Patescibacteria group bacterium]
MKSLVFYTGGDTRVEVHVSILALFGYLFYQGWKLNLPAWHITTACVILLGSVLIHELAHVAAFQSLLDSPSRVLLFAVGGVTIPLSVEENSARWRLAMVALAGPVSNFVLAILSLIVVAAARDEVTANLGVTTFVINVALGVFNLIPSLPFDGGHVFAALLEGLLGRPRLASFLTRMIGTLCGCLLLLGAVSLHDPMLGLTALASLFANSPLARWR